METFNGKNLKFKNESRKNYMSIPDLLKDLTTECLIELLPTFETLKNQMFVMSEIEKRNELEDDLYFELLETCNGN